MYGVCNGYDVPVPSKIVDGLKVIVWLNDHRPPHVHVEFDEGDVVIELGEGSPSVKEVRGSVKRSDSTRALAMVKKNKEFLLQWWKGIHES